MFPIFAGNSASTGYNLTRSLRFRASASAYLSRTPASAGNLFTWTWSGWVKLGSLANGQCLLSAGTSTSYVNQFYFDLSTNQFVYFNYYSGAYQFNVNSTAVYRDPSAWYHVVFVLDTTQATSTNRAKLYVNGSQVTLNAGTGGFGVQNQSSIINNTVAHNIGRYVTFTNYFDGYLAEVNFIDGQALTPSSFGSTNSTTGVWQPAAYTGTYGTNGFYLPFTDNSALTTSSNVGLGKDFSGNANYWVTNNISLTAGVTYDSMTDVPTLTSATAANFAVLNPLKNYNNTIADGNLNISSTSALTTTIVLATIGMSTGKWYWEFTQTSFTVLNSPIIGIAKDNVSMTAYVGSDANGWSYYADGQKYNSGTGTAYGATYTNNDVIGVAFDANAGTLVFYKNNTSQGTAFSGLTSGPYFPAFSDGGSTTVMVANVNFGQRPFSYTPPTGFVALNTYNLPTSTIVKGNTVMDATLYTGTGASLSVTNAASFKPDLVWVKSRSAATDHAWYDSVRGVQKQLESNTTTAETTETTGLTAFGSAGFTVGALAQMNTSAATYVGWQWQAGQGSSSSNTNGTITSTVSVNASAGFSVVTYTGTGANATVGHGLGVAPSFIIGKKRSSTGNWQCWHSAFTGTQYITLNLTSGVTTNTTVYNGSPTSTIFNIGTDTDLNASGATNVAYCWTPIAGFSAFGSYTGNASTDGTFVYLGFRPKFVMIKRTDTTSNWTILDSVREGYNVDNDPLFPNLSNAEGTTDLIDILSNGFKLRSTDASVNASGGTYIYAAFAENPFKNSLAR